MRQKITFNYTNAQEPLVACPANVVIREGDRTAAAAEHV